MIEEKGCEEILSDVDGILVAGGFGERGVWVKWKRFVMLVKIKSHTLVFV